MLPSISRIFHVVVVIVFLMVGFDAESTPSSVIMRVDAIQHHENTTVQEHSQKPDDERYVNLQMYEEVDMTFAVVIRCEIASEVNIYASTTNSKVLKIVGKRNQSFTCTCKNSDTDNELVREADDKDVTDNAIENGDDKVNSGSVRFVTIRREMVVTLQSGNIGVSSVKFEKFDSGTTYLNDADITNGSATTDDDRPTVNVEVEVFVTREMYLVDMIFVVTVYVVEVLEMLTFGTQLDFDVVIHTLKKPGPLLIGLSCQYVGMPLIAFAIARTVASDSVTAIGIFVAGICPGGGSSNIYSYLLDGDLSLSITMTTVSTIVSLGMMPLWLYTLGSIFLQAHELTIPYTDIIVTLSVILVPLSCGLLVRNKLPKVVKSVEKVLTIVITIAALVLIVTGVISSLYLINLFNLKIIIVGCCLPYVGFLLGGLAAVVFKQSFGNVKTIAIETGLQNTAIAMILLQKSFPPPFGDLATVAPVSSEVMSPIPPFITAIVYIIYKKCNKKYEQVNVEKCTAELSDKQTDNEDDTDSTEYRTQEHRWNPSSITP